MLSGLILAEGAGGELLIGSLTALDSVSASRIGVAVVGDSRIDLLRLGGGIGGADCVVAGMEGPRSS